MNIVRVFTGPEGQSHFEDVEVELDDLGARGMISKRWPGTGIQFREVAGDYHLDFHTAPRRQLVVNLEGSVEIEVGDGFHVGETFVRFDARARLHRETSVTMSERNLSQVARRGGQASINPRLAWRPIVRSASAIPTCRSARSSANS